MEKTHKFTNSEVVAILKEVLAAMEVKEVNKFRIRAYQNAISSIDNLTTSVYYMWENGRLDDIPGVGGILAQHFNSLFTTGAVPDFDLVKKGLPEGMFALIGVRGIGAKKAFKLAQAFSLTKRETAIEGLRKAAEAHKIQVLPGFGPKSEQEILAALVDNKTHKREKTRMLLIKAEEVADRVVKYLKLVDGIDDVVVLGSFRRREATVGDLDVAVATKNGVGVVEHFLAFSEIEDVLSQGDKKASVVLNNNVQVDLRVLEPKSFGSMLQYFTGSKQHNILLRTFALEHGMSLSEYGIKKGTNLLEFSDEPAFYAQLGLPYIQPELRQGTDELDFARRNKLPKLVDLKDIRGDLHAHTNFSDGINTLAEMVTAAVQLDYEYFGITDHAPSIGSRGEKEVMNIINTQRTNIEQLNDTNHTIKLLFGYEVNILSDATLSMPDHYLEKLDYAIGSIHTAFEQTREQITKRLLAAIKNPHINIIGHPSGRLINQRQACDVDWEQIFEAVLEYDKILEINAQPERLDLTDDLVKQAVRAGIKLIINTDAHSTGSLGLMQYGIDVARRGWCEPKNILNTLPLADFLRLLG